MSTDISKDTVDTAEDIKDALRVLQSSSTVDMTGAAVVESSETVYRGAIFSVAEESVRFPLQAGGLSGPIQRQVVVHSPAVVMLVHDCERDMYLLEREYRAGSRKFAFGIPAGLVDRGEEPLAAALRELHEETGVVVEYGDYTIDEIGSFYSSEGMTDELVTIMVIHLATWHKHHTHFDSDEYVESAWVSWETLNTVGIRSSNSVIALKHEALRRLTATGIR
jgi:8-oxo-dGTP pyrophosphatase MutT (NUDIX family)